MATCNGCGGVVGRDCYNPSECEWIAQDMERQEAMRQAESVARDAAREAVNEQSGVSLRDYFAAKAMQAAATNPAGADGFTFEQRAEWAYQQADAMLRARTQDASHEKEKS